ncbi:MAG: hypothetical protein QM713_05950 [Arachnia sp.]
MTPEHDARTLSQSIGRRPLLKAAAWTAPVIAVASAAPLAAASVEAFALAFSQPTGYVGSYCGSLSDVVVTATAGALPLSGEMVTIRLSNGFTFDDSATTTTVGPTNAQGQVTVPAIKSPINGANGTIIAMAGAVTTSAPLSAPSTVISSYASVWRRDVFLSNWSTVPGTATATGPAYYITPSRQLLYANGVFVADDVDSAVGFVRGGMHYASYMKGGTAHTAQLSTPSQTWPNVPSDAVALAGNYWLRPNGDLWYQDALVDTGVITAYGYARDSDHCTYIKADGGHHMSNGASDGAWSNVPTDAEPLGSGYFLRPGGDLWFENAFVRGGVTSAWAFHNGTSPFVNYVDANGASLAVGAAAPTTTWAVPSDAKATGDNYFLRPNGDLWFEGARIETDVTNASTNFNGGAEYVVCVKNTAAC